MLFFYMLCLSFSSRGQQYYFSHPSLGHPFGCTIDGELIVTATGATPGGSNTGGCQTPWGADVPCGCDSDYGPTHNCGDNGNGGGQGNYSVCTAGAQTLLSSSGWCSLVSDWTNTSSAITNTGYATAYYSGYASISLGWYNAIKSMNATRIEAVPCY